MLSSTSLLNAAIFLLLSTTTTLTTAAPTNPQTTVLPPPSTLAPPTSGLTFKYAALGLGTQNYTCPPLSSTSSTTAPKAAGAKAILYDATILARTSANPFVSRFFTRQSILQRTSCAADKRNSAEPLRRVGEHYFTAAGTPTFDLSGALSRADEENGNTQSLFASVKKDADAPAPEGACSGRDGGKAVPWLRLVDAQDGKSKGVKEVYRVDTAGGAAQESCAGLEGEVTRDYAALYYFYG